MSILTYRLTLGGEPVRLPLGKPRFETRFWTPSTNAASVYLSSGSAESQNTSLRFEVAAGKLFPMKLSELSSLWLTGTVGDSLDVLTEIEEPQIEEKDENQ